MLAYLWVALGGALGSVGRFWLSGLVAESSQRHGSIFPWNTLIVNVTGSFLIGVLAAFTEPGGRRFLKPGGQQFLMYGVCGGYTTFSSFSLQTLNLMRDSEWLQAGGNIVLSVVLCLVAVWLGYLLGATLSATKGN
jgi:CrcB protein